MTTQSYSAARQLPYTIWLLRSSLWVGGGRGGWEWGVLGTVVPTCNSRIQEAEVEGSSIQGQPGS